MILFLVMPSLFGGFDNYFSVIYQGSNDMIFPHIHIFSILLDIPQFEESLNDQKQHKNTFEDSKSGYTVSLKSLMTPRGAAALQLQDHLQDLLLEPAVRRPDALEVHLQLRPLGGTTCLPPLV